MARVAVLVCLLFLATFLAGCHALEEGDGTVAEGAGDEARDDHEDESDPGADDGSADGDSDADEGNDAGSDDGADDDGDGGPAGITLTIDSAPDKVNVTEDITVRWTVNADDNQDRTIPHTAIHWADFAIADPQAPSDYGNTSGLQEDATIPGTFEATFSIDFEASLFVRAHAIVEGVDFWSDEIKIMVDEPVAAPVAVTNVTMDAAAVCSQTPYDPDPVTIKLGEGIRWVNGNGTFDCAHTATSDDDAAFQWDTETIAKGESSDVIIFDEAGTFTYHCAIHPTSMSGSVVVEA